MTSDYVDEEWALLQAAYADEVELCKQMAERTSDSDRALPILNAGKNQFYWTLRDTHSGLPLPTGVFLPNCQCRSLERPVVALAGGEHLDTVLWCGDCGRPMTHISYGDVIGT